MPSIYDFECHTLNGAPLKLAHFRGKVLLIVNTASRCGFTPQYSGLQHLHDVFQDRGFSVIGFPCNQFGGQEPESETEIGAFCQKNYGVSFPLSEKIDVNGPNAHPLYVFLTTQAPGLLGSRAIKWNFTKFLIDRQGNVVARFAPLTRPEALKNRIKKYL